MNNITIGSLVKTNNRYRDKMYEPLYHKEILEAIVLDINKDNVATLKLLKTSCDSNKRFNYHMEKWYEGTIHQIGLGWLELA